MVRTLPDICIHLTDSIVQSVVGGANLMFGPDMSILLGAAKILSAEGKSKMWDAKADGFARGEGLGVTILKVCHLNVTGVWQKKSKFTDE